MARSISELDAIRDLRDKQREYLVKQHAHYKALEEATASASDRHLYYRGMAKGFALALGDLAAEVDPPSV
jgi:hypothetical protein